MFRKCLFISKVVLSLIYQKRKIIMKTDYKIQTCNGTPEVIKVENGIAKEIVAGEKSRITIETAKTICKELKNKVLVP